MTALDHKLRRRSSDRWTLGLVAATTLLAIGVSIVCLLSGWFVVFQNLFYIPIIIACVRYSRRGLIFSIGLAGFYFLLILAFTHDPTILLQAAIRVAAFIMVAGVVAYLSRARTQAEKSLRKERDHLEELVLARTASLEEELKASKRAEDVRRESERKVSETLEFNRKIMDTSSIGILTYNKAGQCLSANTAAAKAAGATVAQLLAQNFHEILSWKKSGMYPAAISALDTGIEQLLDVHLVTTFGKDVWLSLSFSSFDFAGKRHLLVFTSDVTDRKRAEGELALLNQQNELILRSAAEGILGLDLQGNHTFVNPAAAGMLGYELEELLGRHSHRAWHHTKPDGSPYPVEECQIYAAYRDGAVHRSSTEVFWRKDGTSFPVEYASTPIHEQGRLAGAVVTFTDITERKRAEETLREQTEELRARNEKLTRFNQASIGRELRMVELKKQINELLRQAGQPPRYRVDFRQTEPEKQH